MHRLVSSSLVSLLLCVCFAQPCDALQSLIAVVGATPVVVWCNCNGWFVGCAVNRVTLPIVEGGSRVLVCLFAPVCSSRRSADGSNGTAAFV